MTADNGPQYHDRTMIRVHRNWKSYTAAVATGIAVLALLSTPVSATKRMDKAVFGYSSSPYWTVGDYSAPLSRACQKRHFSQKRQLRYVIGFVGTKGRAITGIAAKNWNLYDPGGLAVSDQTYHFFNDGYSNCAVYVSPQPLK